MNRIVLDASALLALLNNEPGADKLTPELLSNATSSTVNLAEVQTKLVSEGGNADRSLGRYPQPDPRSHAFHRLERRGGLPEAW